MKASKEKLINDVKNLFMVCAGLLGVIIAIEINRLLIFPFFMIFGWLGYLLRPYNEKGEYRY